MKRQMEIEEQSFEAEEWGIAQQMQRIIGELHFQLKEQLSALDYYSSVRHSFHNVKENLEAKEKGIYQRLETYTQLHNIFLTGKPLIYLVYQFTKDKRLLNNRVQRINVKEQQQQFLELQQSYEVEDIKDPKYKNEGQILFLREKAHKWWFIRIIKHIEQSKNQIYFHIIDVEVFLCDGHQPMKNQEQKHTLQIMEEVNKWFKQLIFNVQNRQIKKSIKEIIDYIRDTMISIFKPDVCPKCKEIFTLNSEAQLVQPIVKYQEGQNLYHYSCLFY